MPTRTDPEIELPPDATTADDHRNLSQCSNNTNSVSTLGQRADGS